VSSKVLCVDDDEGVLDAYRRGLRKAFTIETASSGQQALELVTRQGPFAVVLSDMRMPGIGGIQLLSAIRQKSPDTVRIMLTGHADQRAAIDAVNEGEVFRFLTKPCPSDVLVKALAAGIQQHRLVTAEKELLGKTLRGAIKVLAEVLSLTNPVAFGHASRVQRLVSQLCEKLEVKNRWECEVAAMLSQIGCVTIPAKTLEKVRQRQSLSSEERKMYDSHPSIGRELVANIPRLEQAADIIARQNDPFVGRGPTGESAVADAPPLGARMLKAALDFDRLRWGGQSDANAILALRQETCVYDPAVLGALEAIVGFDQAMQVRDIALDELMADMILAEDVTAEDGMIVVGKGQQVSASLRERLKNFARARTIKEPIRVLVMSPAKQPACVGA